MEQNFIEQRKSGSGSFSKKEINTLRSEHLTNGEQPIMASVEGYHKTLINDLDSNASRILEAKDDERVEYAEYAGDSEDLKKDGFLTTDSLEYVISPLSTAEKVSTGYLMCTGVVGVGREKERGENISFLSHQYPKFFLKGKLSHEQFVSDLGARLAELKEQCVPGSIDVVIFGGEYYKDDDEYEYEYSDSVLLLKNEVAKTLGFEPVVITGPKLPLPAGEPDREAVLFDTENRRLYISRPKAGDSTSESYSPKNIASQIQKWREKK